MLMAHDPHVKENTLFQKLSSITNPYVHVCTHTHVLYEVCKLKPVCCACVHLTW